METIREPYLRDLEYRGFVEGVTIKEKSSAEELCHYFGGLPYGLPPVGPFRWRMPRPLPPCYRYGTRANPGRFTGGAGVCPQSFPGPQPEGEATTFWDEDCLQVNIWVPSGTPPAGGWPVFFYIHGGFLQVGSPNDGTPIALLAETGCKCIIVKPAYRLNLFGFLASRELKAASSGEPVGNLGFWDQRLALEWTHKNVSYFGGDAGNITVGGYSAGSHCTFKQLAYDLYLPDNKAIIRRAVMWSNGPGMEPKDLISAQDQFDELLSALDVPLSLPGQEKVALLRRMPASRLLSAVGRMQRHQFRAVVDGVFVGGELYKDIDSGAFAKRMRARNVALLTGECRDEHFLYGTWHPPADNLKAVATRLRAEYPAPAVDALVKQYYPGGVLPEGCKDWRDAFGRLYADVQVHMLERGFVDKLFRGGAGDLVFRYRIEYRLKCIDNVHPPEWGVTHTADMPIWFWGDGMHLSKKEKEIAWKAFIGPFARFVKGDVEGLRGEWGTRGPKQVRRLDPQGEVGIWEDDMWEKGVRVWDVLRAVGATETGRNIEEGAKL